eukprot:TRINITY_DN324_c0_g1_i1.p1 TRINITY_DN324_c0_g1~~TRINITY_DN324_c0_g1_i1.p1  ORF type:complete len:376 (+),score=44.31 TRINITY_DN324_c0_g1_i1:137-1264(+)
MAVIMLSLMLLVVLAVPALAADDFIPLANLTCSNMLTYKCRTGSCGKSPGVTDKWAYPKLPILESDCQNGGFGGCLKAGHGTVKSGSLYVWWFDVTSSPGSCCSLCKAFPSSGAKTQGYGSYTCAFYQWRSLEGYTDGNGGTRGKGSGYCYLYLSNPDGSYISPSCNSVKGSDGVKYLFSTSAESTTVGAGTACQHVVNDPHFIGHQGARYDFNGMPGQAFCLITDSNLHINMKLTGYLDSRLENSVKVVDGKAVRTWMRELGFMWTVGGVEHSLLLATRAGPKVERGEGYMALIKADGIELPRLQEKESLSLGGGLTLRFVEVEEEGPYTVEFYNLVIAGLLDMDIRVRVANIKLRTSDDAEAHFSFGLNNLEV